MIDAAGVNRDPDSPYCEEFHKDSTGCYALVGYPDGREPLWRFRDGHSRTIEAPKNDAMATMQQFRSYVATRPRTVEYVSSRHRTETTAWRHAPVDVSPSLYEIIMGALLISAPIGWLAYWFWRWMGWL